MIERLRPLLDEHWTVTYQGPETYYMRNRSGLYMFHVWDNFGEWRWGSRYRCCDGCFATPEEAVLDALAYMDRA